MTGVWRGCAVPWSSVLDRCVRKVPVSEGAGAGSLRAE